MENEMGTNETAELGLISCSALLAGDSTTVSEFTRACKEDGVFYLWMDGNDFKLKETWEQLHKFAIKLFELPDDVKLQYDFGKAGRPRTSGFKLAGRETGAVRDKSDGFQIYLVPYNELVVPNYPATLACPDIVESHRRLLADYVKQCHDLGLKLLAILTHSMGLTQDASLLDGHQAGVTSTSSLSFLRYVIHEPESKMFGHVPHTDIGSLTFLHASEKGLQIRAKEKEQWLDVVPRENCLVVNVGDSLRLLAGGLLTSALHRVVPHTSVQGHRYSIIYFMRPIEDASFELTDGTSVSSLDLHKRKFDVFASSQEAQSRDEDRRLLYGEMD